MKIIVVEIEGMEMERLKAIADSLGTAAGAFMRWLERQVPEEPPKVAP